MKFGPKLLRLQVTTGPKTRPAIIMVCSHALAGRHSDRLVPRTNGQINNRAQALGHNYFYAKRAVSVKLIGELKV